MYARAQALVAPTSSNTMPRSQVKRLSPMAEMTKAVVRIRWRLGSKGSWEK